MKLVSKYQQLNDNDILEKLHHVLDWNEISKYQKLKKDTIKKFEHKLN